MQVSSVGITTGAGTGVESVDSATEVCLFKGAMLGSPKGGKAGKSQAHAHDEGTQCHKNYRRRNPCWEFPDLHFFEGPKGAKILERTLFSVFFSTPFFCKLNWQSGANAKMFP